MFEGYALQLPVTRATREIRYNKKAMESEMLFLRSPQPLRFQLNRAKKVLSFQKMELFLQ